MFLFEAGNFVPVASKGNLPRTAFISELVRGNMETFLEIFQEPNLAKYQNLSNKFLKHKYCDRNEDADEILVGC